MGEVWALRDVSRERETHTTMGFILFLSTFLSIMGFGWGVCCPGSSVALRATMAGRLPYCTRCGMFEPHGLQAKSCGHATCMRCSYVVSPPGLCDTCAFDTRAAENEKDYMVMLIPRPRDSEARAIVGRHCILRGMVPAHHMPALHTEEVGQAFVLASPDAGMGELEREANEEGFRLSRYLWDGRPCAVLVDTRPYMFTICWGGERTKAINQDNMPMVMRRLFVAMSHEFWHRGVGTTTWINVAGGDACAEHWDRAFGEELNVAASSQHLRYVAYDAAAYMAVAVQSWAMAKKPVTVPVPADRSTAHAGVLTVPRRTAAGSWTFKGWPPEMAALGAELMAMDVVGLPPVEAGTEEAWTCVPPPPAPPGMAVIAHRDDRADVCSISFTRPPVGDREAQIRPLIGLYRALCSNGVRIDTAEEIARRLKLSKGCWAMVPVTVVMGAALVAWSRAPTSAATIDHGGRTLERAWFEGDPPGAELPVRASLLRLHNCLLALGSARELVCSYGGLGTPVAGDGRLDESTVQKLIDALDLL